MTGRTRHQVSQPRPGRRNVQPMSLATDAELAHALDAAHLHFRPEMDAVMRAIRRSLRGRDPRELVGGPLLRHLELRQRFLELAADQVAFAEAELARGHPRI